MSKTEENEETGGTGEGKLEVCVHSEWDPIDTVIVGNHTNFAMPYNEEYFIRTHYSPAEELAGFKSGPRAPYISKESKEATARELDNFIHILKDYQARILRPEVMDWSKPIVTPFWSASCQNGVACPRDVITVVGKEIFESGSFMRCRAYEFAAYRKILLKCLDDDPEAKLTCSPKPLLKDGIYRPDWVYGEESRAMIRQGLYFTTEDEILFEAADIMRLGRDVFMLHSFSSNKRGNDWFRRQLAPHHRVHTVELTNAKGLMHIDGSFIPVKPPDQERKGIILETDYKPISEKTKALIAGSFDVVLAASAVQLPDPPRSWMPPNININMLSLNQNTLVSEAVEKPLHRQLESLGLKVIPAPFRNCYEFGGSFHCHTTEIKRRGEPIDYFPQFSK